MLLEKLDSAYVELESDLKAIRCRLDALDNETFQFMSQVEDNDENGKEALVIGGLRAKMSETGIELGSFDTSLQMRKKKLDSALCFQKFMVEYRELKAWIVDVSNRVEQQPGPGNLSEALEWSWK